MEEITDPNLFCFAFPVYVLAVRSTLEVNPGGQSGQIGGATLFAGGSAGGDQGDVKFIAVFTEPEFAERYARQPGVPETVPLVIRDPLQFLQVVKLFPEEATHLSYDPGAVGTTAEWLFPLSEVVAGIQKGLRAEGGDRE